MKKERTFWGIMLVLGGIALIISKLGYFSDINVITILLTIYLSVMLIKNVFRVNFAGVLFPIAFICIIYDEQLGITSITPGTVLIAALLGSVGLSIIFDKRPKWANKHDRDSYKFDTIDVEDESHVRVETQFSASVKYINTDKFEQAYLKCQFGATKVYFDNAVLHKGKGMVTIDASFAGVELYIPKTWTICDKTNVSFGSLNEKNRNQGTSANTLTIMGDINFSGVEIIYV